VVRAIKYKVSVYESGLHWLHEAEREIEEVFIPSKKIAFNIINNSFNAFRCEAPRGSKDLIEIEIDDEFVEKLEKFIELKEELINHTKKILPLNSDLEE